MKAGVPFGVTNTVTAGEEVLVYAVEETVPPGWSVGKIGASGFVDITHGKIKWGPFFDRETRLLTYELVSPPEAVGEVELSGIGSFNGEVVRIDGMNRFSVQPATDSGARDEIVSLLPETFLPGESLWLTNKVTLADTTVVYSVEDQVPIAWSVGSLNHGGKFDASSGKVKWGPFLDHVARELICELKPPAGLTNAMTLTGVGWFDGRSVSIGGQRQTRPVVSTVVSLMPAQFQAGELITVTLTATPVPATRVFAVEDRVPSGWSVSAISHNGEYDARIGRIKWGPFFTNAATRLSYDITAPDVITNTLATFSGLGSFDGVNFPITGQRQMTGLSSQVVRLMAGEFLTGTSFPVTNRVIPDRTVRVYAVEDEVPLGFSVSAISHDGSFDAEKRRVKWGPFFDQETRALVYTATPPGSATGSVKFRGTGSFNGVQVSIAGQQEARAVAISELNKVVRLLTSSVRAARSIQVTNQVSLGTSVTVYAVEDQVPAGWTASEVSHEGVFDGASSKVKWGPFFDASLRDLSYRLATPTNAAGRVTLKGTASFNAELVPITGASNILAIANHVPVARDDVFQREPGQPAILMVAALLANDSDPDDDPLSILDIDSVSVGRGTVKAADGVITYRPPTGADQPDSFAYAISDGFGGVAKGVVRITVITPGPSLNRWRVETFPDGTIRLRFAGIPGRTYQIQATDSLKDINWVLLESRVANLQGDFEFHDTDALNHPARFYRTVSP